MQWQLESVARYGSYATFRGKICCSEWWWSALNICPCQIQLAQTSSLCRIADSKCNFGLVSLWILDALTPCEIDFLCLPSFPGFLPFGRRSASVGLGGTRVGIAKRKATTTKLSSSQCKICQALSSSLCLFTTFSTKSF